MRRPETFPARQPGANLKSPVNRSQLPLGIDPPAGVMHRAVIPDPAPQTQAALLEIHVVRHIILELIVLAVLADEDIPLPGVELVAVDSSRQMSFQPVRGGVFSSADSPADSIVRKTVIASVSLLIRLLLRLTGRSEERLLARTEWSR